MNAHAVYAQLRRVPISMLRQIRPVQPSRVARLHGALNLWGGIWPLLHLRSFEAVFGPKVDRWLVYTVAGLLTSIGYAQWQAATSENWRHARRLGIGTAGTLLAIDLTYVPRGRIRWTYLVDAAAEVTVIVAWLTAERTQLGPSVQSTGSGQERAQ
jgi:hypothetical protein